MIKKLAEAWLSVLTCISSSMASSSSPSISTLSMTATETLAVWEDANAFLKRVKNPLICRRFQWTQYELVSLNLTYRTLLAT